MSKAYEHSGFKELEKILKEYTDEINNVVDVLEIGAQEFTRDLLKLPKPISKIRKAGYTHLVNSFAYRKEKNEIPIGWGKYYGPMLEYGTKKMDEKPHIYPLWNRNKEKYYKKMLAKLGL